MRIRLSLRKAPTGRIVTGASAASSSPIYATGSRSGAARIRRRHTMSRFVFCDFEFDSREVILGCFFDTEGSETALDFRDGKNRGTIQNFIVAHADHVWVAYAAKAEMESLLRLGIDIAPMRWIDLMAEATMITGTHRKMWVPKP